MEKETKEVLTEEQANKALDDAIDIIYDDLAEEVDSSDPDSYVIEHLQRAIDGLKQIRKERRK